MAAALSVMVGLVFPSRESCFIVESTARTPMENLRPELLKNNPQGQSYSEWDHRARSKEQNHPTCPLAPMEGSSSIFTTAAGRSDIYMTHVKGQLRSSPVCLLLRTTGNKMSSAVIRSGSPFVLQKIITYKEHPQRYRGPWELLKNLTELKALNPE